MLAAAAGVALGLLPGVLDTPVSYAAEAASGAEVHAHLALWHGVNTALLVSAAIIVLGLLLVALRRPVERVASHAALPFSALDAVDEVRHRLIGVGAVVVRHDLDDANPHAADLAARNLGEPAASFREDSGSGVDIYMLEPNRDAMLTDCLLYTSPSPRD